ncbi:hypothetical protein [Agaribacterium haliotis]|uniref:hypothetical protein n=1 Tax=Agaribacterium haliotis TaxID=2013869 RepID=UPI000BB53EBA|nr:hypothetical protein [Agaribacterium haliotis]
MNLEHRCLQNLQQLKRQYSAGQVNQQHYRQQRRQLLDQFEQLVNGAVSPANVPGSSDEDRTQPRDQALNP